MVHSGGRSAHQVVEGDSQIVEAEPGRCVGGHHRGPFEERALHLLDDLQTGQVDQVLVGQADLG